MPVRISATQSNIIKERWNRDGNSRGWTNSGGRPSSCWPEIITLDERSGALNNLVRILYNCPGRMMPEVFLNRIFVYSCIEQAICPNPDVENCEGDLVYRIGGAGAVVRPSWDPQNGFHLRENDETVRAIIGPFGQNTEVHDESAEGCRVSCIECGWRLVSGGKIERYALAPSSARPNSVKWGFELGFIEDIGKTSSLINPRLPRRDRIYTSPGRMIRLTQSGIDFAEADSIGSRSDRVSAIEEAFDRASSREKEPLPGRGLISNSAREAHMFSLLTDGFPYRDTTRFIHGLLDARQESEGEEKDVTWSDMAVMQCYYGRDFDQGCEGCKMRSVCPLLEDMESAGLGTSDQGCLPNLIRLCESIQTTEGHNLVPHEYNAKRNYTFRFEWEGRSRVFDWTDQVSKETPIPFNISVSLTDLEQTGSGFTCRISRGQQQ